MKWSENTIARALVRQTFQRKHLVIVPCCGWTGDECDLLVVTPDLRIIDVEIKISRADLKADAAKDKWYHAWDWHRDGPMPRGDGEHRRRREWPRRVWKHYYVAPAKIWEAGIPDCLPAASGCLSLASADDSGPVVVRCLRAAKPCRDAERISAADAVDIARLASLRMWDTFAALDRAA